MPPGAKHAGPEGPVKLEDDEDKIFVFHAVHVFLKEDEPMATKESTTMVIPLKEIDPEIMEQLVELDGTHYPFHSIPGYLVAWLKRMQEKHHGFHALHKIQHKGVFNIQWFHYPETEDRMQ